MDSLPLVIVDYLRETGHLTTLEHGAYLLLMIHACSRDGGSLPADEARLRAITRMAPGEWERSKDTLLSLFQVTDSGFRHTAIGEAMASAKVRTDQKRVAGYASAEARKRQQKVNGRATPVQQPFNTRSTDVGTPVKQPFNGRSTDVAAPLKPRVDSVGQSTLSDGEEPFDYSTEKESKKLTISLQTPQPRANKSKQTFADIVEHVTVDSEGNRAVGGWLLDKVIDNVRMAAKIYPEAWLASNERPIIQWLAEGLDAERICEVIAQCAKRPGYIPPNSLKYFDQPVRAAARRGE